MQDMENFDLGKIGLRPVLDNDFDTLLKWDRELGWFASPPVIKSWLNEPFRGGFRVAEYDGKPVGTISGYHFTDKDTFVGFYVVTETLRGKGIGKRLWDWLLTQTTGRNLWLTSASHNIPMYEKMGFRTLQPQFQYKKVTYARLNLQRSVKADIEIQRYNNQFFDELLAYDFTVCGYQRLEWLSVCVKIDPEAQIFVARKNGKKIVGYGVSMRNDENSYRISPLYADTDEIAYAILNNISTSLPENITFISEINMHDQANKLFREIIAKEVLDNLEDCDVMVSGENGLTMVRSKVFCFPQNDTMPF